MLGDAPKRHPGRHSTPSIDSTICSGTANGPDKQPAAGMAAGGHYDPAKTGKHLGPFGEGHKGDMSLRLLKRIMRC
jgi:Cu-Zn family superoxide dismutase